MRIGFVAPPWLPVPPNNYGGTETVVDRLARGLHRRGHEVVLFATGDSTSPVPRRWIYDEALGFRPNSAAFEARHVLAAHRELADCDVIHDHTVLGPLLGCPTRAPVVWTNHGPFDAELDAVFEAGAERGAAIVAISHRQAELTRVPVTAVIHHGLDVDRYPAGEGNGGYALFLGRMSATKGVTVAIDVARRAGVPLRIAAKLWEPDEIAYFESEVEPRLGGEIEYLGEVSHDDKLALLQDAFCLLNPIQWEEPFGLVMIEALASGTPVVTTDRGAAGEIVDDGVTGFLADSMDALADAVIDAKALDRGACRRRAEQRFTTERMIDEHEALFARLIA